MYSYFNIQVQEYSLQMNFPTGKKNFKLFRTEIMYCISDFGTSKYFFHYENTYN